MSCRCRTARRRRGSRARPIHSRVRSAAWVGAGIEDVASSQASKVLPVGNAARARRVAGEERSRPATSSVSSTRRTSAGSQRCAFAVARTSGAARRMCGSRIRRSSASRSSSSGGGVGVRVVMAAPRSRWPWWSWLSSVAVEQSTDPFGDVLEHPGGGGPGGVPGEVLVVVVPVARWPKIFNIRAGAAPVAGPTAPAVSLGTTPSPTSGDRVCVPLGRVMRRCLHCLRGDSARGDPLLDFRRAPSGFLPTIGAFHVLDRPLVQSLATFVAADPLVIKVREGGRVVNVHALVATWVNGDGHREITVCGCAPRRRGPARDQRRVPRPGRRGRTRPGYGRRTESTNAATSLPSPNGRCAPTGSAHGFVPGAPSLARAR